MDKKWMPAGNNPTQIFELRERHECKVDLEDKTKQNKNIHFLMSRLDICLEL
jgi:hypothetical protein